MTNLSFIVPLCNDFWFDTLTNAKKNFQKQMSSQDQTRQNQRKQILIIRQAPVQKLVEATLQPLCENTAIPGFSS